MINRAHLLCGCVILLLLAKTSAPAESQHAVQLSAPVRISANGNSDEDPSLIHASDGRFYVVWSSRRSSGVHLFIKSSENGERWTGEELVTSAAGEDYYPSLIQSRDGIFHLVWFRLERKRKDMDIWYSQSRDARNWTNPIQLSHAQEPDWAPSMVEDSRGILRVIWSSSQTGNRELFMVRSDDHGKEWSGEIQVTHSVEEDDFPQILEMSPGKWVLVWTRYRPGSKLLSYVKDGSAEIVMARSSDGATWSSPEVISPPDEKKRYLDLLPFVFVDAPGQLNLAWTSSRTDRHGDVLLRALADDPANYQRLTTENSNDYDAKVIPTKMSGKYLMTWVSNREGKTAIFSRSFEIRTLTR